MARRRDDAADAARRTAITAQIQADTAIDEAMIERLVRGFYERVRDDNVLGPIFTAKIEDWESKEKLDDKVFAKP